MTTESVMNDRPVSAPVRAHMIGLEYRQRVRESEAIAQAATPARMVLGMLAGYPHGMTRRLWINTTHARRAAARRRLAEVTDSVGALALAIEDVHIDVQCREIAKADRVGRRFLSVCAGWPMDPMTPEDWRTLRDDRRQDAVDRMLALLGALTGIMYAFQYAREEAERSLTAACEVVG